MGEGSGGQEQAEGEGGEHVQGEAGEGAAEMPQLPTMTEVTPWESLGRSGWGEEEEEEGERAAVSSWAWVSMNPGESERPERSYTWVDV